MKTCLLRASWAAAITLIASSPLARATEPIIAFSPQSSSSSNRTLLPVGTRQTSFLEQMGSPDAWLSREVCAYWNRTTDRPELSRGYDTLLVEFGEGRVTRLRLVAKSAIQEFLRQREKAAAESRWAALPPPTKPRG